MISLIIPFFNEENELPELIKDFDIFEKNNKEIISEYIFINDCSTDNSLTVLKELLQSSSNLYNKKIIIFTNSINSGWCKSLNKGYDLATQKYSLFVPGDGEARITEFLKDINFQENRDVIVYQRKSMSGRPRIRVWISYLYRIILGFGFNLPKVDFNGIILIKSEIIKKLQLESNSNFISAEIILRSKMMGCYIDFNNYFSLFPKNKYKSTSLSFFQLKKVIFDLLRMYFVFLRLKK